MSRLSDLAIFIIKGHNCKNSNVLPPLYVCILWIVIVWPQYACTLYEVEWSKPVKPYNGK